MVSDLTELRFIKDKKGWRCIDTNGNYTTGATKQIAENQYNLLYNIANRDLYMPDILSEWKNKY